MRDFPAAKTQRKATSAMNLAAERNFAKHFVIRNLAAQLKVMKEKYENEELTNAIEKTLEDLIEVEMALDLAWEEKKRRTTK